jgi:hypothetical protein
MVISSIPYAAKLAGPALPQDDSQIKARDVAKFPFLFA